MLNICPKSVEKVTLSSLLIIKNHRKLYFIITLLFCQKKKYTRFTNHLILSYEFLRKKIVAYFDRAIEFNADGKESQMENYVL